MTTNAIDRKFEIIGEAANVSMDFLLPRARAMYICALEPFCFSTASALGATRSSMTGHNNLNPHRPLDDRRRVHPPLTRRRDGTRDSMINVDEALQIDHASQCLARGCRDRDREILA